MAESWFSLSRHDQLEALEFAAARTGRPAHLLEKDIWVVWVLSAIYESDLASKLTFKGGTSLGERYSRQWYDLAAFSKTPQIAAACAD